MNHRPITEDDLHAYVDRVARTGAAGGSRRLSEAIIRMSPSASPPSPISVSCCVRRSRRSLRNRCRPELNLSRIIESRARRPSAARWAVAAMLLLSIGGLGGWAVRGSLQAAAGRIGCARAGGRRFVQRLCAGPCPARRDPRVRQCRSSCNGSPAGCIGRSRCRIWPRQVTG